MPEVSLHKQSEIPDEQLIFTVIAARYRGQWIFSQHKKRSTWEIPGGRREPGESVEEAARRELWEETGAEQADIRPVCAYGVTKEGQTTYGMLFFAEITSMGLLPEAFEMARTILADGLPENLTYPDIVPKLFERIQCWLNLQSSADELWDVYDKDRKLTGRFHRRGKEMQPGDYHLVVEVWMMNSAGQFLLTKRSPNKGYPNMWESTGGSAVAGEDSLTTALREVKEETGLTLDPVKGRLLFTLCRWDSFKDIWLFRQDFDLKDVILQPGETTDKMYANKETILSMHRSGSFVPLDYLERLFDAAENRLTAVL